MFAAQGPSVPQAAAGASLCVSGWFPLWAGGSGGGEGEIRTRGRISVRPEVVCAEHQAWLSTVRWERRVSYLNLFQDIAKYQRTLANVLEDSTEDLEFVVRVTGARFLQLLEESQSQPFQDTCLPSRVVLRLQTGTPMGLHGSHNPCRPRARAQQGREMSQGCLMPCAPC